jgi:putative redox protein
MATVQTEYSGALRTKATHVKSGNTLITDAPVDNHGRGEAFSPTDLVATALGSCMLTVIGIAAETHHFSIEGTRLQITKIMAENPRRISEIVIEFDFNDNAYSEKEKKIIEYAAQNCPVAKSLHPDMKQSIQLNFTKK